MKIFLLVFLALSTFSCRKHLHESYRKTNRLLQQMLNKYSFTRYNDVTNPWSTPAGMPRPEIYSSDSLHLNETGYAMWKEIIRKSVFEE